MKVSTLMNFLEDFGVDREVVADGFPIKAVRLDRPSGVVIIKTGGVSKGDRVEEETEAPLGDATPASTGEQA